MATALHVPLLRKFGLSYPPGSPPLRMRAGKGVPLAGCRGKKGPESGVPQTLSRHGCSRNRKRGGQVTAAQLTAPPNFRILPKQGTGKPCGSPSKVRKMLRPWTVGLVVVDSEAWPLRRKAQILATWDHPCAGFWRARWADVDLVVARTAPGKVNAALATQALLQRNVPDLLMSVGTAGALGDLAVGDVVIATQVQWHDTGLYLDSRFIAFGGFTYAPGRGRALQDGYRLPPALEAAIHAWAAHSDAGGQPRVTWGKVVTGDQVVLSSERKRYLRERLGALAVEMESASVVQVAEAWGIPWLVVRAASDLADSDTGFDFTPLARWQHQRGNLLARSRSVLALLRLWATDPQWHSKRSRVRQGLQVASAHATDVALALASSEEVRRSVEGLRRRRREGAQ